MLTSPALVAAVSVAAGLGATLALAGAAARALTAATARQLADAAAPGRDAAAAAQDLPGTVLAYGAPIAIVAAAAALLVQGALARGLWLPWRDVPGAPSVGADPATAGQRASEAALAVARTAALLVVAVAAAAAALSPLARLGAHDGAALAAIVGRALATVAIAAVALAVLEVAVRWRRLEGHLAMTERERRAENKEQSGDPGVRQARRAARADDRQVLADARVVVVGEDDAVAIGWRPGAPPRRVAHGRGLDARRIVAAARGRAVPIVADGALAMRLAAGPAIADAELAPLAAVLAAVGVSAPT